MLLKQKYDVSNPFDKDMAYEALKSQIESSVFEELISTEKDKLVITFTIEVVDNN